MKVQVQKSLKDGLKFLAANQAASGRFSGYSSSSRYFGRGLHNDNSFFTALIAGCLSGIPNAAGIHRRAAYYLLAQRSLGTTWNYWERGSLVRSYPDDLDDTACAIIAIVSHDAKLIDAAALAKLAQSLISCEVEPGGPYTTWLTPSGDARWQDIDVAVNANIGGMFAALGVESGRLEEYISDCLTRQTLASPYYIGDIPALYFMARWYRGPQAELLVSRVEALLELSQPAMHRAMLITAMYWLGKGGLLTKRSIRELMSQQTEGVWAPAALYFEPPKNGQTQYAGSSELTTAFVAEALYGYITHTNGEVPEAGRATERREVAKITDVVSRALGSTLSTSVTENLNQGSIHGWAAYTLYDDIMDGDADSSQKSLADEQLQASVTCFRRALPDAKSFHKWITTCLAQMDRANDWEQQSARDLSELPNYKGLQQLAQRSWGHIIAPTGALVAHGFLISDPQVKNFQAFMKHYIIAKQLCDDAHDWQDDIEHNRATAVVVMVLQGRLGATQKELQLHFWQHTILEVNRTVRYHVKKAQKYLNSCDFFVDTVELQSWLTGVKDVCARAEAARDATLQFIQTFTDSDLVK